MTQCKYLKQKLDRTLWCKLHSKKISLADCSSCDSIDYKLNKSVKTLKKAKKSLIEKQKKRFSIINPTLTKCIECGSKIGIELNEIFEGAKRGVSMTHGFVIPLCHQCHQRFHSDREFALKYKRLVQSAYERNHTREDFISLIHHNYL